MGSEIKLQKFQNLNFCNFFETSLDDDAKYCQDRGDWMAIKKIIKTYIYRERGLKENKKSGGIL